MRSCPLEGNDSYFSVLNVNQQPVGVDVTLPTTFVLAMNLMVSASFGKGFVFFQKVCDGSKVV